MSCDYLVFCMESNSKVVRVGCGAIIINGKNEVLLALRRKDSENEGGLWARPGGKVEFGETVEEIVGPGVI